MKRLVCKLFIVVNCILLLLGCSGKISGKDAEMAVDGTEQSDGSREFPEANADSTATDSFLEDGTDQVAEAPIQETVLQEEGNSKVGPGINELEDNRTEYPNGEIPKYEKFEITFQVDSEASNFQLPYDSTPPIGILPEIGISVDAVFIDPQGGRVQQPAFYFQEFEDEIKGSREWFYPNAKFSWKVRFSPDQAGSWHYFIQATDKSGTSQTTQKDFVVTSSSSHGFIRVSQNDPRYFEYDDGTYFPATGYNMNYSHVAWNNPILDNEDNFKKMSDNGIQLVRIWLSEWAIFGAAWNPWNNPDQQGYFPFAGLTGVEAYPGSDVSLEISSSWNKCMSMGWEKPSPALKPGTTYQIRIRYKTQEINGPAQPGLPYGFVAKTGGWLFDADNYCDQPGVGTVVTDYQPQNTSDWQILQGSFKTNQENFLQMFYLVMENVNTGTAYVDMVWIQEDLGNGQFGPNIVYKPWMAHHYYFDQRNSYAFDKVLQLARQYDIYLRPVIMEKNDPILSNIDFEGNFQDQTNNDFFYGDWRNPTKVRWLQQAWWRYLQARWGYSPQIHSWELLNEGDPFHGGHYVLTDELGKFMHCTVFGVTAGDNENADRCNHHHPNAHLVSTSTWHSFPNQSFWSNSDYPNVDFADIHQYLEPNDISIRFDDSGIQVYSAADYYDSAAITEKLSRFFLPASQYNPKKPVIRGETGFQDDILDDEAGIWLHNFVWGAINPGGLIESYWYENQHIYTDGFDHRYHFKGYFEFIKSIPLNNGQYQDAQAQCSHADLLAWGQKDLINQRAHLWIANTKHTWKNVADSQPINPVDGTVTLQGFSPNQNFQINWFDTSSGLLTAAETASANSLGELGLSIQNLSTDIAAKIQRD